MNQTDIISLLSRRERFGVRSPSSIKFSSVNLNKRVHITDLSILSAWSPKRMQNMILSVGAGTPAAKLKVLESSNENMFMSSRDEDASSVENYTSSVESDELNSEHDSPQEASHLTGRKRSPNQNPIDDGSETIHNENASDASHSHSEDESVEHGSRSVDSATSSDSESRRIDQSSPYRTTISHSGCINTAAWLDCPWRLSTVQSSSHSSNSRTVEESHHMTNFSPKVKESLECPTQIMTSGDDRMVKFWDCSRAMGSDSPVPCPSTRCPFAYSATTPHLSVQCEQWKRKYSSEHKAPGYVECLASLRTGHRGNVFHVTPLHRKPGQVLTCAADGLVNLCSLETEEILTVLALNAMCFSLQMLDSNIGLVCGENGLHRFDLRVPRVSQPSNSLLKSGETCKACAIYSAANAESSSYIFAGGASEVVLYDLRFLSDSAKVVQQYRPSCFSDLSDVPVSGIDISKDRKELLVSYESDQIYTFPVFPSNTDPTADDLLGYSNDFLDNSESGSLHNNHFAGYGGHLNRFTFLKCAKFAGPNDEYICTGSDSGHAFVYEKYSGSVVSLLKADKSTCNGIVPHPTLPIFITYGIESTAKLWRATPPVNDEDDDSSNGRRRKYHQQSYEKSVLASRWPDVRSSLAKLSADPDLREIDATIFPDELALRSVNVDGHVFEGLPEVFFRSLFRSDPFNPSSKIICNDLENLPQVLRRNYYEAVSAIMDSDEIPVKCGLNEFHRRIGLIRLYHQSNQLGISIDPDVPWDLKARFQTDDVSVSSSDLIPNYPADWLPYDNHITPDPLVGGRALNREEYEDFYFLRYNRTHVDKETEAPLNEKDIHMSEGNDAKVDFNASRAWDILHEKINTLKEEGNKALAQKSVHSAARLYDKALAYCSIAFLGYPQSNLDFLTSHQRLLSKNSGHCIRWSLLFKTYISVRLNLSMTLLKDSGNILDTDTAYAQASLALFDLRPFTSAPRIVLTGKRLQKTREDEPIETYQDAKVLEAKAYFRLGSAKLLAGQYAAAMHMFEKCLASTKDIEPDRKPDKVVVHRLAESKRLFENQKKKRRKKFKFALNGGDGVTEDGEADGTNN